MKRARSRRPSTKECPYSIHGTKEPLTFYAPFNSANGYGSICDHLAAYFDRLIPLQILTWRRFHERIKSNLHLTCGLLEESIDKPKGSCLVIQGLPFVPEAPTDKSAAFTMHEATKLEPEWVKRLNTYKVVIVPNHENKRVFEAALDVPVRVVHLGHDPTVFRLRHHDNGPKFVFGAAGDLLHCRTRKGIDRVCDWFFSAFPTQSDVQLKLKLNDNEANYITRKDPRIEIVKTSLTDRECADWLSSLDCFVDASTAEGWGLWPFNAMACGTPCIGKYYGGQAEFYRFGNHIHIGHTIGAASEGYKKWGDWAYPIDSEGIEAMRWAYNHPNQCRDIGREAAESVRPMTWEVMTERLLEVLNGEGVFEYTAKPPLWAAPKGIYACEPFRSLHNNSFPGKESRKPGNS
jgi:glycosyltransferase involved in cell wall biosynthesis